MDRLYLSMLKVKIFVTFLFISTAASSQSFRLNAGVGFPDLPHIGFAYESDSSHEFGIQFGYIPTSSSSNGVFTGTIDLKIALTQSKKYHSLSSWFFGIRPSYYYENTERHIYQLSSMNFSLGKHIYFSEKYGLSIDVGMLYWLNRSRETKEVSSPNVTGSFDDDDEPYPRADDPDILPNFRIQFFRRF